MVKNINANQIMKLDRPWIQPVLFVHVLLDGETLYFSDRNFNFNGHDYEDYLEDLSGFEQSILQFGGYQNIKAKLRFSNLRIKTAMTLLEYFDTYSITRREMELYSLYVDTGEVFGSDVSTKLLRAAFGEIKEADQEWFDIEVFSILHHLDSKNIFTEINITNWPNAAPNAIGKQENIIYGSLRDIPCPCVQTYAVSTLFLDMAASGETYITLSNVDYPISFPSTGVVQIGNEKIQYSAKDSANKRLTVQTRAYGGTTAAIHKRAIPCWLVESPVATPLTFKYLVAGHQMKSVSVVYAGNDRIRINSSGYTVNLNEGGKTTITFTERQILKVLEITHTVSMNEGSHYHSSPSKISIIGNGGLIDANASYTITGTEPNMRDQSDLTNVEAWIQINNANKLAYLKTYFPAWGGPTISKVYACITHKISSFVGGMTAQLRDNRGGGDNFVANLSVTTTQVTQKFLLDSTIYPTQIWVYLNTGNPGGGIDIYVYELWLEVEYTDTGASPASGVTTTITIAGHDAEIIAPLILCDGEGYKDDGLGTYTGVASALIENPSDVRRHLLVALLGRSMGEIGDSFGTIRTTYVNRVAGGYKFGVILSKLGLKITDIFRKFDEQSRSNMREDGGKFELTFNDTASPTSQLTIDNNNWLEKPKFSQTSSNDIKNLIRATYDIDWGGVYQDRKYGDYKKQTERSNGTSISKYGTLPEDWEFPTIQSQVMAEDVADWILLQKKDVLRMTWLVVDQSAAILERGDYFTLNINRLAAAWTGLKWKIVKIIPNRGDEFSIDAIQFIGA